MPAAVRTTTGLHNLKQIYVRDNLGFQHAAQTIKIRDNMGVLRTVFGAMTVTTNPNSSTSSVNNSGSPNITSPLYTATVTGGTSPYTGTWIQVGTPADVWTINTPNSTSTSFTAQGIAGAPPYTATANFAYRATDAAGSVVTGPTITVNCRNSYSGTPGGGGPLP